MAIAILGGGILGSCTALELADRGHEVVLFERNRQAMSEASLYNEGKLHLGFVYAADPSFRTAARMIDGAIRFMDTLQRWIPSASLTRFQSKPFDYIVHRDSMVDVPSIELHFDKVRRCCEEQSVGRAGSLPIDGSRPAWRRLSAAELAERYNPAQVLAAYETNEIALDTWSVAACIRDALHAHPSIEVRLGSNVEAVRRTDKDSFEIFIEGDESCQGSFECVLNALWANRPFIDEQLGILQTIPWYTRRKLGVNIVSDEALDVPSFTVMLGPFGDVVKYGSGRVYISWYPDCMIGVSTDSTPTNWSAVIAQQDVSAIRNRTLHALMALCPSLAMLEALNDERALVDGGSIFANGESDIGDPRSKLHQRLPTGYSTTDGYFSVDTSKYTLGPATALDTADRIEQHVGTATAR